MPSGVYIRTKKRSWKVKDSGKMGIKKGTNLSKVHKDKIRNTQERNYASGKITVPSNLGRLQTSQCKKNISKSMTGKSHSEIHIKRIKKARAKQIFPFKDTKIEVKIQNFLKLLHVEFMTHYYVSEITHAYQCDIYVPSKKLIIEADGCYWHGCLICNKNVGGLNKLQNKQIEKDETRTKELEEKGFKVIRLWEHDINKMSLENFNERLKNKCVGYIYKV